MIPNPNDKNKQPWNSRWKGAKSRCTSPTHQMFPRYGGRGIKFNLAFWEMGVLYWRDNAHLMKRATIDRIDNDGDYVFSNCRFIENSENSSRANKGKHHTLGYKHTVETRAKMSKTRKGRPALNKGVPHSEETKRKISESNKGNPAWNKGIVVRRA